MKKRNWIVVALCVAIVGMGIGFAALAQNLQINATANITGQWDVRIIHIGPSAFSNNEIFDTLTHTFDGTSATFGVDLPYPGAMAEIQIVLENRGNIDAILNSITGITAANSAEPSEIQFRVSIDRSGVSTTGWNNADTTPNLVLDAGGPVHVVYVRVEWIAAANGELVIPDAKTKTATINLNYVQNT